LLVAVATSRAQPERIDPRSEQWRYLPEMGRMTGTLRSIFTETGEEYGRRIVPLGDVNNDGLNDWAIARLRCDTLINGVLGSQRFPEDVLVYLGVRGGLPSTASGVQVGLSEGAVLTSMLCAGDFDADGNRDIVLRFQFVDDTSFGNSRGFDLNSIAVFWGNGTGEFSLQDTTRLQCESPTWMSIASAGGYDLNGDHIDDLLVWSGNGFKDGRQVDHADLQIFRGGRGRRWGRNGVPRTADWYWWSPPAFNRISSLDHDCDGARDLALFNDQAAEISRVSILYGNRAGFPDTTSVESVTLTLANGHYSIFSEITGDGSAELVVNTGSDERLRIYAGRPGQRLGDQYGSGYDPPIEGKGWWRRPWAEILLPFALHDAWTPAGWAPVFDLGSSNGDGSGDMWAYSEPELIVYMGGAYLDEFYDASIGLPARQLQSVARLGDIDGSGMPVIAVGYDDIPHAIHDAFPGGILFVKPDTTIYANGGGRNQLPHLPGERCENTVAVTDAPGQVHAELLLQALPNPSGGDVIVRWPAGSLSGQGMLRLLDESGREIWRSVLRLSQGEAIIPTSGIAAGAYYVSLIAGVRSATARIVIQ
jgi:hypothetical protein